MPWPGNPASLEPIVSGNICRPESTMGRLYDRTDLEWELDHIERLEQETNAKIARGELSGMAISELNHSSEWRLGRYGREKACRTIFDQERQRARMRLLRTGQLISDFSHAKRVTRACGACHTDATGRVKACPLHKRIWRQATLAIKFAAEENELRRISLGQPTRPDDAPHDGACNHWEAWYFSDRRDGIWPGQTAQELAYNKEAFESLDYRGWLNMMRYSAEEISEEDFRQELKRLQ